MKHLPLILLIFPIIISAQIQLLPSKEHHIEQFRTVDFDQDGDTDYIALECKDRFWEPDLCQITLFLCDGKGGFSERKTLISGMRKNKFGAFLVGDFDNDQRPDIIYSLSQSIEERERFYHSSDYFLIPNSENFPVKPKMIFRLPRPSLRKVQEIQMENSSGDRIADLGYLDSNDKIQSISVKDGVFYPSSGFYFLYSKDYEKEGIKIKYKGYKSQYLFLDLKVYSNYKFSNRSHHQAYLYYQIDNGINGQSGRLTIPDMRNLDFSIRKKLAQDEFLNAKEIKSLLNAVENTPKRWVIESVTKE